MKRFISKFPGYFTPKDLEAMQIEFDAGEVEGESWEEKEARALRILQSYETRRRSGAASGNS